MGRGISTVDDGGSQAMWAAGSSSADASQAKLATTVADRIVADIVAAGWPVGEVLGSEPELLMRYGVSRAVFREAVRLVEHQHIAVMRRGPGGGLVVTAPTIEAITDAVQLTLFRIGARLDEVFEAREVLEGLVTQLTASSIEAEGIATLEALVEGERAGDIRDHRVIHAALAGVTGNPAIELFVELLNRVTQLYLEASTELSSDTLGAAQHAHARIVEAIAGGDGDLAEERMLRHLRAENDFLRAHRSTRDLIDPLLAADGEGTAKLADEVARSLIRTIVEEARAPGDLLGSEGELMEHYGVSRAIVREAVQLLEHYDVAAMRRGPGGGLIVLEPNLSAVTDVIALYLEYHGVSARDVFELRVGVEVAMVELLASSDDPARRARLEGVLLAEDQALSDEVFKEAATDLHAVLASLSGNRVLELITVVLISLGRMHEGDEMSSLDQATTRPEVTRAHRSIVASLENGDAMAAQRRMRRHLEELSRFYD